MKTLKNLLFALAALTILAAFGPNPAHAAKCFLWLLQVRGRCKMRAVK